MKKIFLLLTILIIIFSISACDERDRSSQDSQLIDDNIQMPLFIPELLDMTKDGAEYEITVDETKFEFFKGYPTLVKSYNEQGYLGKTIKLKRGSTFFPLITNNLSEVTTVHWHGLEVNGENDGAAGHIAKVHPGESKTFELSVNQPASTIWYHPHPKGFTASQVYEGLSGMIIIDDDQIGRLNLPDDYGVNDIPLIIQAKKFDSNGNLSYGHSNDEASGKDLFFEDGSGSNESTTRGFHLMTNGQFKPYLEVKNEVIRLRTLNGSNHGNLEIALNNNDSMHIIATDGGLLEHTKEVDAFEIAAAERVEVLVDLSGYAVGDKVDLLANDQTVLTLRITGESSELVDIPDTLVEIIPYEDYSNQEVTHQFVMANDLINQTPFDHNVINEIFKKNEIYYFEVINKSHENHSFHIHNSQFLVVEKNGERVDYRDFGWKDTIYLRPNESMVLQVVFKHTGDFMYHCHILMHEEYGMMGKFRVYEE